MSTAANHRKRSYRSNRKHFQAAGIVRRQVAADTFKKNTMLMGTIKNLFRRSGRSQKMKVVEGEIVDG